MRRGLGPAECCSDFQRTPRKVIVRLCACAAYKIAIDEFQWSLTGAGLHCCPGGICEAKPDMKTRALHAGTPARMSQSRGKAAFSFHVRRQRQMSLQATVSELVMRAFHRIVMCTFRNRPTMLQRISSYSSNANQHSKFFLFFRCVSKLVMTGHRKEGAYRYIYPKNQSRKIILCTILQPMTSGASIGLQ